MLGKIRDVVIIVVVGYFGLAQVIPVPHDPASQNESASYFNKCVTNKVTGFDEKRGGNIKGDWRNAWSTDQAVRWCNGGN